MEVRRFHYRIINTHGTIVATSEGVSKKPYNTRVEAKKAGERALLILGISTKSNKVTVIPGEAPDFNH
jgi:hypothetical protein